MGQLCTLCKYLLTQERSLSEAKRMLRRALARGNCVEDCILFTLLWVPSMLFTQRSISSYG